MMTMERSQNHHLERVKICEKSIYSYMNTSKGISQNDVDYMAPGKTGSSVGPISKWYKININNDLFSFICLNTELLALCDSFMYSTPLSQVPVPGHCGAWQKVVSCRGPWQSLPPWADAGWEQARVRVFSPNPPQDREQELQELQGDNPPCTGQCCREQFHLPCSQPLQGMYGKLTITKLVSVLDAKETAQLQIQANIFSPGTAVMKQRISRLNLSSLRDIMEEQRWDWRDRYTFQ